MSRLLSRLLAAVPPSLLLVCLDAPGVAQGTTIHEFPGNGTVSFGFAVAGLGDLNGDGRPEIGVGTSNLFSNVAFVYSGMDGALLHTFTGTSWFGTAIASVGDVGGGGGGLPDGVPDIGVGSLGGSPPGTPGYVQVFSGASGGVLFTVGGPGSGVLGTDNFGFSVAGVGDGDGDGVDDFIVGAAGSTLGVAGYGKLYSGSTHAVLQTFVEPGAANLGWWAGSLGDVTGDAVPDFAFGAPLATTLPAMGRVYRYAGGTNTSIGPPIGIAPPPSMFGGSFGNAGDLDFDGVPDLAVTATGFVYTVSGASGAILATVPSPGARPVAGLGDVNGDGFGDFAVGAPFDADAAGTVRIFCGSAGALLATLEGDLQGDLFGDAVANAGDVDGDGKNDLVVGATGSGASNDPYVRVLSLASLAPCNPGVKIKRKVDFQRDEAQPDPDASGRIQLSYKGLLQTFLLQLKGLGAPAAGTFGVFLEDGVDAGTFTHVADLTLLSATGGKWSLEIEATGAVLGSLGTNLLALEGRRVEIRDGTGTVFLWAVVPDLQTLLNSSLAGTLAPPASPPTPGASGTTKLKYKGATGNSKFDLKASGLAVGPVYTVWIAEGTETFALVEVGELVAGRFQRDTKKGQPLPLGVATVLELSGRAVEIREGATVHLVGTLP